LNYIINTLKESATFLNKKDKNPNVIIETDLDETLINIKGSEVHLNKVLLNLIVNAFDAMPNGGNLKISTRNEYIDKSFTAYDDIIKIGEYVSLTIEDSGAGIKNEYMKKIFEPFFSKKIMTKTTGSGLGLAIVYGVVKDHNGHIVLESEYGSGTKFKIYFPSCREKLIKSEKETKIQTGNESILIVDDDEGQREVGKQIFESLGYKVSSVSNGRSAVEFLRNNEVDLVILDMIMEEDFDGLETWKHILAFKPLQKAIIVSGYSETDRVKATLESGVKDFIRKPYTMEKIASVIRKVLDNN
jgi:two-component system, cell cycle sensor histidine kinase and response regulator CckA